MTRGSAKICRNHYKLAQTRMLQKELMQRNILKSNNAFSGQVETKVTLFGKNAECYL